MTGKPLNPGLPEPGDVFLIPLANAQFGACRILQKRLERGNESILVVASAWTGSGRPGLADPTLTQILVLNNHARRNLQALFWTTQPIPADFTRIGSLIPSPTEQKLWCSLRVDWSWLLFELQRQWRWDNDRDAVLAEEEQKRQKREIRRNEQAQRTREHLAGVTLDNLRTRQFFTPWQGVVPAAALQSTREIFTKTIDQLLALDPKAPETVIIDVLQGCIQSLNALNIRQDHFIGTNEREDLCNTFNEIVHACNLDHHKNLADKWREW